MVQQSFWMNSRVLKIPMLRTIHDSRVKSSVFEGSIHVHSNVN